MSLQTSMVYYPLSDFFTVHLHKNILHTAKAVLFEPFKILNFSGCCLATLLYLDFRNAIFVCESGDLSLYMSGTQGRGSAATLIFLSLPFLRTQVITDAVVKIRDKESSTRIHGHLLKSFLCNLVTIFYQDHVYQFFLNKRVCRRSLVIN